MIEGAKKGQPAPNIWYVCYILRWNFGPSFPLKEGKLYDIIYIMPVGWPESAFLRFWFPLTTRLNGKCMLGDQDWLTLLSWRMPASFYQLPCAFNFITDMVNKQLIARYELWRGADISFDLLLNFYTVLPLQVEAEESSISISHFFCVDMGNWPVAWLVGLNSSKWRGNKYLNIS